MDNVQSLSHSKWECKYHVVWIPKCRRRILFGQLRRHLGDVLHDCPLKNVIRSVRMLSWVFEVSPFPP